MNYWSILIAAYIALQSLFTLYCMRKGRKLARRSFAGTSRHGNPRKPVLKVFLSGDSVMAGVGASRFETSLPGRIAAELSKKSRVILTNAARSGSRMAGMRALPKEKQDIIALFISSNDLFHFIGLEKFESGTAAALKLYSGLARKIILTGPADIGGATAIPLVAKPFYAFLRPKYVAIMARTAARYPNVRYVNPLPLGEKFKSYGSTEAADYFHPNDNGHKFWADIVISAIQK